MKCSTKEIFIKNSIFFVFDREQLNASKKRNPNKQISRSMRSLTDGDILYENEFVALPPKTRRNRKRNVVVRFSHAV